VESLRTAEEKRDPRRTRESQDCMERVPKPLLR